MIDLTSSFSPIVLAVVTCVLYVFYKRLYSYLDYWEKQEVPCFNPSWRGCISMYLKPLHLHEKELYQKFGWVYGRYDGSLPVLTVGNPDILKNILVKDANIFQNRRDCQFGDPITDNNLSLLSGEDWKRVRNILTPSFTASKLRNMLGKVYNCAERIIGRLSKAESAGESADLERLFGGYALDVIAICAFGTRINSLETPDNPFVVHAKAFFASGFSLRSVLPVLFPSLMKLFRISMLNPVSNKFFRDFVQQIVNERQKSKETAVDFLQLLLDSVEKEDGEKSKIGEEGNMNQENKERKENSKYLTQDEMTAQCVLFFLAGYETTSSLLSFTMYSLALHQDIQNMVFDEINDVLKNKEKADYDDINAMKYLDTVICEALRISSSCIRMDRRAEVDYTLEEQGITIRKGQLVSIPFYCIHHDPEWYPNPEFFDPERFAPEARSSRHPFVYLPFGLGPRSCIGTRFALMEVKLLIILIVQKFVVSLSPKTKVPLIFKEKQNQLVPDKVFLKLKAR